VTSFDFHIGAETLIAWVRDQQQAIATEAQPLADAEPADAVARLLVGVAFTYGGYLLVTTALDVSGALVVSYALAGRAATTLVGLAMVRLGLPRCLSGAKTVKKVRAGEYDTGEEAAA